MDTSCILQALSDVSSELNIQLKDQQVEAILKFCQGHDVFVSLPTGFGKSMSYALLFDKMRGKSTCFMIAMFLNFIIMFLNFIITAQPGSIVVCVSPLIAIMKEQAARFSALGISAEFVGEDQTDPRVKSRVLRGNVQLLFISPENLLCNWVYRNMLLTDQYKKSLVCVAVDEVHCVKTW